MFRLTGEPELVNSLRSPLNPLQRHYPQRIKAVPHRLPERVNQREAVAAQDGVLDPDERGQLLVAESCQSSTDASPWMYRSPLAVVFIVPHTSTVFPIASPAGMAGGSTRIPGMPPDSCT